MWARKQDHAGLYRALREMRGLSERALAEELGVSRRLVTTVETGERPVPRSSLDPKSDPRLTRQQLDQALALGGSSEIEEDSLWYALGEVHPAAAGLKGYVTIQHPEVVYEFSESADAVEGLLRSLGIEKAAVPIWESLARERAERFANKGGYLDLDAIIGHLASIKRNPHWPVDDDWPAGQLLDWDHKRTSD